MTTLEDQLAIANALLNTGLVSRVYHSCEMLQHVERGKMYPAYPVGEDYHYAGIDDGLGLFAYIRYNGDRLATPLKVTSCARSYEVDVPLRVVVFSDNEARDRHYLLSRLASFTFLSGLTLVRVIDDKYKLLREESDMFRANMDARTFYVAWDVLLHINLLPSTCEQAACSAAPNPLCTPWAAAVTASSGSATS